MKTLYLIRHADASWSELNIKDYERPLLEKGIKSAEKIVEFLNHRKIMPDIIVSSHAKRAMETSEIVAKGLNYSYNEIQIDTKLYNEGTESIGEVVFSLPDDKNSAIIVGHNPYITQFSNEFLNNKIDYLPPAGMVSISYKTDRWNEIFIAKREVNFVINPDHL